MKKLLLILAFAVQPTAAQDLGDGRQAIINASIDTTKLSPDAVGATQILNGAVQTAKLAAGAVDTTKIYTAASDSGKILASCGGVAMWRTGGTCP